MTPEIRIRRFNLRIRRRACAWAITGDDHRALAERVRRLVLAELEPLLTMFGGREDSPYAALATGGGLDLELRLSEVAVRRPGAAVQVGLRAQLERALQTALATHAPATKAAAAPDRAVPGWPMRAVRGDVPLALGWNLPAVLPTVLDTLPTVLETLLRWRAEDTLESRVALLDAPTRTRWLAVVLADLHVRPAPPRGGTVADEPTLHSVPTAEAESFCSFSEPKASPLLALLELATRHAPWRPPAAVLRAFREAMHDSAAPEPAMQPTPRLPEPIRSTRPASTPSGAEPAAVQLRPAPDAPPVSQPMPRQTSALPERAEVETALPLLLAGPLARVGWFDAAGVALRAAGRVEHASVLGFALAVKALPPPARGWRRMPGLLRAAALAAGLAEPPPGAVIAATARALAPDLRGADVVLADALLRGHAQGAPVGLVVTRGGLLALFEPEGLFPIGLGATWHAIAPLIPPSAPVLAGTTVPPGLLRAISDGGTCFAAPGAPVRGESWHVLRGPSDWWGMTNATGAQPRLGHAAAAWGEREAQAVSVIEHLGADRPLAPGLGGGPFDRSITLAAAVALGSLAWQLAMREPVAWAEPDPLLALERFQDLSARLRISPTEVEVLLPLGPRSHDLRAAGMLADIAGVPWFAPRQVRFGMG
ncbi:MAG: hypothetical protein AB7O44_26430 [Hyphomicrobiaceae bacterium]